MPAKRETAPLPKLTFASVAVVVSDRKKSLEWYTKKLGLDVIDKMDHWVTVGRKGHGGVLHLCQSTEYDKTAQLEPGNSGIGLHVPGKFEVSCAALAANGVRFSTPPTKEEWGTYAVIVDPDGNEINLSPSS